MCVLFLLYPSIPLSRSCCYATRVVVVYFLYWRFLVHIYFCPHMTYLQWCMMSTISLYTVWLVEIEVEVLTCESWLELCRCLEPMFFSWPLDKSFGWIKPVTWPHKLWVLHLAVAEGNNTWRVESTGNDGYANDAWHVELEQSSPVEQIKV